jgi:hypothetical protein
VIVAANVFARWVIRFRDGTIHASAGNEASATVAAIAIGKVGSAELAAVGLCRFSLPVGIFG